MEMSPPKVRLRSHSGSGSLDDALFEESRTPRTRPLGRRADDNGGATSQSRQPGSSRFMSATSAAFTRVKGMTIRSGSSGRVLKPRSVTLVSSLFSPSRERRGDTNGDHEDKGTERRRSSNRPLSPESNTSSAEAGNRGETNSTGSFEETEQVGAGSKDNKLSVIFDDDESNTGNRSEGGSTSTNPDAAAPRSKWASTLMASTRAREKTTGKTAVRGRVDLLPRPRDAGNKVRTCRKPRGPHQFYLFAYDRRYFVCTKQLVVCRPQSPLLSSAQLTGTSNSPFSSLQRKITRNTS